MEKFIVEVSARHVHITKEQLAILFGEGHELTVKKQLSQPGQYVCEEKVSIVGPRGEIKASILGPVRSAGQVEITLTEARTLGLDAKVRESGDIDGTSGVKLVGPNGEVELENGVIAAKRHIHMTSSDAEKYGVTNGEIVSVKVETEGRSLIFGDTVVRVRDDFALAMHIDTDEGNAAGIKGSTPGEIVK